MGLALAALASGELFAAGGLADLGRGLLALVPVSEARSACALHRLATPLHRAPPSATVRDALLDGPHAGLGAARLQAALAAAVGDAAVRRRHGTLEAPRLGAGLAPAVAHAPPHAVARRREGPLPAAVHLAVVTWMGGEGLK